MSFVSRSSNNLKGGGGSSKVLETEEEKQQGLDFYFGRPTEMMRKLDAKGKATGAKKGANGDALSEETLNPSTSNNVANAGNNTVPVDDTATTEATNGRGVGYLLKWQRDRHVDDEDDANDDDEESPAQNTEALAVKHRARWQLVTGNVPSSSLTIAAYFENGIVRGGKPLGRDGLVNCGGVILQAALGKQTDKKVNFLLINETNMVNTNDFDSNFHLRSDMAEGEDDSPVSVERLMFRKGQWPPEAPEFPPPPPDGNESVSFRKVPIEKVNQTSFSSSAIRRMSRVEKRSPLDQNKLESQTSFRGVNPSGGRVRAPSSNLPLSSLPQQQQQQVRIKPIPEQQSRPVAAKPSPTPAKSSFLSFLLPSSLSNAKKEDSSVFPGVFASYVMVPYMLPPPPQPERHPPPGSNDEKRSQKQALKRMFLEDQISIILEMAEEKARLKDMVRDLEAQIMDTDAQMNSLMASQQ